MEGDHGAHSPGEWASLEAIATLTELNTRCFAMLAESAHAETITSECAFYRHLDLWRRVDQRGCERAGRCPVLLLDLNFENLGWWKRVCRDPFNIPHTADGVSLIAKDCARSLLREILMGVWRLGSALPNAANLLFGMAPGVSVEISKLSVSAVERIADGYARDLRPRWEENDVFWKSLLEAAIGIDDEALFTVSLHCLQLLGSELEYRNASVTSEK